MEHKWKVIYYETEKCECYVQDFISSKSINNRVKIYALISFLEEKGPNLPRPYADFLIDGIHELRIKLSGNQIRILYFFCYKKYIILTHHFLKTTDKVPITEINKAKMCRANFLKKFNDKKLLKVYYENI
jgi:hypothetical protein